MTKVNRRKAIALLLGGMGCLGGCETTLGFKKPVLPESCYWLEFPYAWVCFPLNEGALPELGISKAASKEAADRAMAAMGTIPFRIKSQDSR